MLIGIDMIAAQSPEGGDRLSGRFARRLAAALLEHADPSHRFVLYLHEGMSPAHVPTRKDVPRVTLAPVSATRGPVRRRLATQRLIDRNPDGLDWLVLLDPFEYHYGGPPPEAAVGGLKLAAVAVDLSAESINDRALRPLGRYDLILAVGEGVADAGRRRLGGCRVRIRRVEPFTTPRAEGTSPAGPMTLESARVLGDLGVSGRFVVLDASSGLSRSDLVAATDAFADLPLAIRSAHQLVIVGQLDDPDSIRHRLDAQGCTDRLVVTGPLGSVAVENFLDRSAVYLSPATHRESPQAVVEALGRGAAVLVGTSLSDLALAGGAAVHVDPTDRDALAGGLASLLAYPGDTLPLRGQAQEQAHEFPGEITIEATLSALGEVPASELGRIRFHPAHKPRPRVALFPSLPRDGSRRVDLAGHLPAGVAEACAVDIYLDAANLDRVAALPVDLGGFDARLFGRNDAILRYAAVIHQATDATDLLRITPTLRQRGGLVHLDGPGWDEIDNDLRPALEAVLATGARLVVEDPWLAWDLQTRFGRRGDQIRVIPGPEPTFATTQGQRDNARDLLSLPRDAVVLARVCDGSTGEDCGLSVLHAFKDLARTRPNVALVLVTLGSEPDNDVAELLAMAARLRVANRVLAVSARDRSERDAILPALDLAIVAGSADEILIHLLRADVPVVVVGEEPDDATIPTGLVCRIDPISAGPDLVTTVRHLVTDPGARQALVEAAQAGCLGVGSAATPSAQVWAELVSRPGGTPILAAPRERTIPPHFPRAMVAVPAASSRISAAAPRSR